MCSYCLMMKLMILFDCICVCVVCCGVMCDDVLLKVLCEDYVVVDFLFEFMDLLGDVLKFEDLDM